MGEFLVGKLTDIGVGRVSVAYLLHLCSKNATPLITWGSNKEVAFQRRTQLNDALIALG